MVPGTLIAGKYRVEGKLGEGGMGVVYAARHATLGVRVAIKVLAPTVTSAQHVARFLQEAKAAARIESDHVARVTDVGETSDGPFMVMELLEGQDLDAIVERAGALEPGVAVAYLTQALAGIADAHALGFVHRDLKPSNLFVARRAGRPDKVKLLDFGISKASGDGAQHITTTGSTMGSPAYMSPEQVRSSKNVDTRADIWSIGVIAYELLSGSLPFDGESVGGTFAAILENVPEPLAAKAPSLPKPLCDVVMRCLEKKPENRFASAMELSAALAPFAGEAPTSAGAPQSAASRSDVLAATMSAPEERIASTQATFGDAKRSPSPRRARIGAALVLAVAAAAVASVFAFRRTSAPASSTPPTTTIEVSSKPVASETSPAPIASPSAAETASATVASARGQPRSSKPIGVAKAKPSASHDDSMLFLRH